MTLKQIYRNHGFEINRDDQKGTGNKCLENVEECFKVWLIMKLKEITKEQEKYEFDPIIPMVNVNELLVELEHNPISSFSESRKGNKT
jgi:hypothetical protein